MAESYVVGFRIFDGRSLQTEDGNPCDPYVMVECHNERFQSTVVENRDSFVPWNETCIWPGIEMFPREFDTATIEFSVYARRWCWRDFLIGKTTLQLTFINQRRHHLYARRWLPLTREDTTEVTGMLNVSVFALKPGEQAPSATQQEQEVHDDDDGDEAGGGNDDSLTLTQAMMKAKVDVPKGTAHYVQINVHRVDDLRELVFPGGLPSPYVTVEFAGCQLKTSMGEQVKQFAFNECLQIPVRTPLYEDAIILKLWSAGWLSSDELLAQGVISFSELRNRSLAPRWFPLYGWNVDEVPDMSHIAASGGELEPNYFKGSLLISGVVVTLEEGEPLQPANKHIARTIMDPKMMQVTLLADVYMVVGAEGRNCRVELSFGAQCESTLEVACETETAQVKMAEAQQQQQNLSHTVMVPGVDPLAETTTAGNLDGATEEVTTFNFDEKQGYIRALVATVPEDPASQPWVMINVYVEGVISQFQRVGCAKLALSSIDHHNAEEPPPPRFHATHPMPNSSSKHAPSVLIAIEQHHTDDIVRFKRAEVRHIVYIVRAYCFLARRISFEGMKHTASEADNYALRVSCAGMSKTTKLLKGPRPTWMEVIDLKVILCANAEQTEPTIEPITLTLIQGGSMALLNQDVAKATCHYTHVRKRDKDMKFEPFRLTPQWIVVSGGAVGNKKVGEILVDFELLQWKHRKVEELQPREMWPQPEDKFNKRLHICRLKKATLHFSLHGLRDIRPLPRVDAIGVAGGTVPITKPTVEVEVFSFIKDDWDEESDGESKHVSAHEKAKYVFPWRDELSRDLQLKSYRLKKWTTKLGGYGEVDGANFEYLQVGTIKCLIPDHPIFEPYIIVRVLEELTGIGSMVGYMIGTKSHLVGESRLSLGHLTPCCWLRGVNLTSPYAQQLDDIKKRLAQAEASVAVRETFQQKTADGIKQEVASIKQADNLMQSITCSVMAVPYVNEDDDEEFVDSKGIPEPLRRGVARRRLHLTDVHLNMQEERGFSPRKGDPIVHHHEDNARKTIHSGLEESSTEFFHNDFWFKNVPLLRNQDILEKNNQESLLDWNFQSGRCYGFVRCTYKLVDGWDDPADDETAALHDERLPPSKVLGPAANSSRDDAEPRDLHRLKQSFEIDDELDSFAFDKQLLPEHFKSVPSRVRVRLYFVKAITIYSKSTGFADPYLDYQLGRKHHVQLRNMAQFGTNTPDFYRIEECDIELPEDSRLEVRVMDLQDMALSDTCIGSTVVDLEDRWHSREWQRYSDTGTVPIEVRSLFSEEAQGKNRGSMEMWVEMHDVTKHDVPPSFLRKPADMELEVRFVIWTASEVKLVAEEDTYTNVKITTQLDCKEYNGEYPALQETDVHFTCKDGQTAVFNWRMVYPNIKMPVTVCNLLVTLYHYEMSGDTYIGNLNIGLKKFVERVARDSDALTIGPHDLKFSNSESTDDEQVGSVNMTMYVLTQGEASSRRVGIAREEPNEDPQLITPTEGRDWGTYFEAFGFQWPDFGGIWKKMLPMLAVVGAFLLGLVLLKLIGIL